MRPPSTATSDKPLQPLSRRQILGHSTLRRRVQPVRGDARRVRLPLPDSISDDAAGLLEPLSVGVWACRRTQVAPGSTVLVTGAGPIGLIAAQTARAYGADAVTLTDVNPHRLRFAEKLGLGTIDVSHTSLADAGLEPDVLLECSGNARATWDAVSIMGRAGRVVLVGMG